MGSEATPVKLARRLQTQTQPRNPCVPLYGCRYDQPHNNVHAAYNAE